MFAAIGAWLSCAFGGPLPAQAQGATVEGPSGRAAVLRFDGELCRHEVAAAERSGRFAEVLAVSSVGAGGEGAVPAPLQVAVRVRPAAASGFLLVLSLDQAGEALGERRITGASCDEVLEAAALVVSLALSPAPPPLSEEQSDPSPGAAEAVAGDPPPAGAGPLFGAMLAAPPQRLSAALGAPPARSAATLDHVGSRRREGPVDGAPGARPEDGGGPGPEGEEAAPSLAPSLGASLLLAVGELPVAAPGVEARVAIAAGPLRLEGAGRYLFDQEVSLAQHPTGRVRVGLAAGSVGACLPLALGALTLGPCAGLEVGAIWGASSGVTDPGAATSPWVAPWATATVTLEVLSGLRFRADAGLSVPVVTTDFVVDGIGMVHQPGAVTFRLGIGAEVHFR